MIPSEEQLENALYQHKKEVFKHKKAMELLTMLTEAKWALKELMDGFEDDTLIPAELHILEGLGGKIGDLVDRYREIKSNKIRSRLSVVPN